MSEIKVVQKIAAISVMIIFIVSCSNKVTTIAPAKAPTKTQIKAPVQVLPASKRETWEYYLNKIIRNREEGLLYEQMDSG
jgi:hypothetical protein